jgi:hypothetical protein
MQASPRHEVHVRKFLRSHSTHSHSLILLAVPIVLSGCGIITGAGQDERFVAVAGSVMDAGMPVASVTAYLHANKGLAPRLTFYWRFSAPPLEGHVTSVALVHSARPVSILLQLPIREPIEPWGYAYAYEGTLEQRAGEATPLLGGIFEVLATGDGVLELTTDLSARPHVRIPLAVAEKRDWQPSSCRT